MLVRHIEYLLQRHDCVIVPGLGAFLAHAMPARYDAVSAMWHAPVRALSFNPELSRTDGLLAASVARKDNIPLEVAAAVVRRGVDAIKHKLEVSGRADFGNVGTLEMTPDGLMSFVPGDVRAVTPAYTWLPDFEMSPLARASELERISAAENMRRAVLPAAMRRVGQIAACIAVLFALGWVVARNIGYSPAEQFASVLPVDAAEAVAPAVSHQQSPVVLIMACAPKDEVIENITAVPDVKPLETRPGGYYLVVASCSSQGEAERYLREHKDINLGILARDGRYRIFAAAGDTADEVWAASQTEAIASRYPSCWVCR